ncbi:MAG: DUF6364 family protein [Chthoniobacterales bacterium]
MKTKLTLTIDGAAIKKARAFARREKTSLSQLVEEQFKQLEQESFADKWYGKFPVPPADPADHRMMRLRKKYLGLDE